MIDLDPYMDLSLVQIMEIQFHYDMGKLLEQKLDLWMVSHLLYMMLQY